MKKTTWLLLIGLFVSLGLAGYGSTFSTEQQPPGFPLSELLTIPKGLGVNVPGKGASYVIRADEAGLKFIRMDFVWSSVETTKGVYNFAIYDAQVEEASNRNVGIMYILDYQNSLYCSDKSCQTDAERNAFAAFAEGAAARYAGKQILWEIWNEPNGNFWSPQPSDDAYTKLVEVTAPRIKAADPTAIVVAPSMSRMSWEWLENCFKRGLLNWIDAVTVHPYRNSRPETVISDYERIRNLIKQYAPEGKKDMPIISGEWGYSIFPEGEPRITEEQQAQYLARMFLVNIYQGIPLSIWYCIYNGPDPEGPDPRERNFGLITWEGVKKPNYFAAQTICQKLAGYSYTERLIFGDDYVLKLRKGQNEALAMWTVGGQHNATLPIGAGNGTLIQMLGSESTISWGSSGLAISISQSPQYLLATYPNNAQYISQSVPTSVTPGSNFSVSITMKNIGTKTWTTATHYLGSQNPQDNTTWGIRRISLPNNVSPGSEVTFIFTVTAPTRPGTYNFQWRMFEETVEWFGDFTPKITVETGTTWPNNAHYISQDVPMRVIAGNQFSVTITMANRGTKTWSTSHRLGSQNPQDNTTWGRHRVYLTNNVSPGSEVTFSFTVTAPTTPGTYNFQWRMLEEMVEWFGDFTPNVVITVEPGTPGVLTPELANVGHGFFCVAKHEGTGEMWAGTFGDQGGGTSACLYVKRNGTWQLHSDFSSYAESIYRLIYHPGTNKLYANMEVWTKNPSIFRLDGDTWVSTGYGNQYSESSKTMGLGMGVGADGYIYATTVPMGNLPKVDGEYMLKGKAYIFRSIDGVNWASFPSPDGVVISHYYTFNGQTYAVTSYGAVSGGDKKLLRLNGTTWDTLYSNANLRFYYLIELKGNLYMSGEDRANDKAVVYRWNGTSCQQVYAAGTGTTEAFFQQMAKVKDASHVEWLYAGYSVGWRLHGDSSVHRSNDGTTWSVYQTFPGEGECWAVGTGETDYTLYVGTKNQGGGGRMYCAVFSTGIPPPTDLTATALSTSEISLSWSASTNNVGVVGYIIFRDGVKAGESPVVSFVDTGLRPNTRYTYYVVAFDEAQNMSIPSASVARFTLSIPPGPDTVTCDKEPGIWHNTSSFTFTAVGGFGEGTLSRYRYAWNQNPTHSVTVMDPDWRFENTLTLTAGTGDWYLHLKSYNGNGIDNGTYTFGPFRYDGSPPQMGAVAIGGNYTDAAGPLNASWSASDPESGIAEYQYAVGTSPNDLGNVLPWTSNGLQTSVSISEATLISGVTYYVGVKARNSAGSWSTIVVSDGTTAADVKPSIGKAKDLSDGRAVILKNKIVSAKFAGHSYIMESDRSSGLRVNASSASEGTVVDVAGMLSTVDGERAITSASVAVVSRGSVPLPLGVVGRDLGGGDAGMQQGVWSWQWVKEEGTWKYVWRESQGLNNIGLLIRTSGKVTQIGDGYLYINDGSNLKDGTFTGAQENTGVRVICDTTGYEIGDYLIVTGISSCFETPSGLARRILTRDAADIVAYQMSEASFPSAAGVKSTLLGRRVTLGGSIVTATPTQMGGYLYAEDASRASGIRIDSNASLQLGDMISASGVVARTVDHEIALADATVDVLSHGNALSPIS